MNISSPKYIVVPMLILTGCSHALETNLPAASRVEARSYQIAKTHDNPDDSYVNAVKYVEENLAEKGFRRSDDGAIYLTITLSHRPSDTMVLVNDNQNDEIISDAKDRAFLKFCDDNAFKLSIMMQDINNGETLYNGSATQRRCDIDEQEAVRYLASVATSSLLPQ